MKLLRPTDRQIIQLALPSIISNITVPLLGLVDLTIVGHIGNETYIGAIAIGTMVFNVIYWLMSFLRMGTGGMTSQAYGRRRLDECRKILMKSGFGAFTIGLLFILLQTPLITLALWIMDPDESMRAICRQYCLVCIYGAPAQLCMYVMTGWYIGMQNTRIPMVVSILQNIINIVASLTLVYAFGMGITGVAAGTVIALWSGLAVSAFLVWKNYRRIWHISVSPAKANVRLTTWREMMAVNRDIFFRTLFIVAVSMSFTAFGSREGAMLLAVNTLLMQFFTIFSYFSDGFAYAGEALCGRYYGAKNHEKFNSTVYGLFRWGALITVVFTLLYAFGGHGFLRLLTDNDNVVDAAMEYYWWAVLIPAVGITAFILDGVFVGITATKSLLLSSGIAAAVFFTIWLSLGTTFGNHALWMAFLSYLATRGIVEVIIYRGNHLRFSNE